MSDNPTTSNYNPFSHRETHSSQSILLYKITTAITWLLFVVSYIYFTFREPRAVHDSPFWLRNSLTPFSQDIILTSVFWAVLFIIQLYYHYALYTSAHVAPAANLASHFIASNLLLFGFVHLFVRAHFWIAEVLLVINFFNLSAGYFRNSTSPRWIHIGVLSGPLAWNFIALYWVGALAVGSHSLAARIVANVAIWGWLGYGVFFLAAYKDYSIGLALSWLTFSTAIGTIGNGTLYLEWIFAFTIGGLLLVLSLAVGLPGLLGREPFARGQIVSEDRERAPLLADE